MLGLLVRQQERTVTACDTPTWTRTLLMVPNLFLDKHCVGESLQISRQAAQVIELSSVPHPGSSVTNILHNWGTFVNTKKPTLALPGD